MRGGDHAIDIHLGQRMRARRRQLDKSQAWLAEQLGVTFQQVAKWEAAKCRMFADALYQAAKALEVRPGYFFEGLG